MVRLEMMTSNSEQFGFALAMRCARDRIHDRAIVDPPAIGIASDNGDCRN